MSDLLQLPAIISKISSKGNRALKIVIDTNEDLTDIQMQEIMCNIEQYGWFCFLQDKNIKEEDIVKLPPLPAREKTEKTPSQRLRDRMFVYYKEKIKGDDFNSWHEKQLEKIGNSYLDRLN